MSDQTSAMMPGGPPKAERAADATTHVEPAHAAATPTDGRAEGEPPTRAAAAGQDQSEVTRLDTTRPLTSASLQQPQKFGDYEVLAEVARGGMGVVYRARQSKLGRTVALKMILGGKLANEDDVKRFRTEAAAAANLSHPNIVAVHEVGEIEGQHFFSMEFIEGASLAQKLAAGPLAGKVAARYVLAIAKAVQHAHRHGILHRDLKPSNIMLDADDEPHVTDFGLAKRLGDSGQTRSGAVLGTPSYMAPEQAAGRTRDLGPGTDVYGLGALLYELLSGRPPFRSESPMDTLLQVLENEPVPPTLLNPKVDPDLETICLKCLEKDPARRYLSAEELAGDLQRYLNGDSITARSFNVLDRLARTLDRSHHDVAFSAWSTMIFAIAAIVFFGHMLVFALIQTGQSRQLVLLGKMAQFAAIGYLFWQKRSSSLLPTTLAERLVWTIWIGYIAAYGVSLGVSRFLVSNHIVTGHADAPHGWEQLMLYPFSAVISGLAFFVMGSNYWGRFYAFGVGFFALALLMPMFIEWAPLVFGCWWSVILFATGMHLRHVGMQSKEDQTITMISPESLEQMQQNVSK